MPKLKGKGMERYTQRDSGCLPFLPRESRTEYQYACSSDWDSLKD